MIDRKKEKCVGGNSVEPGQTDIKQQYIYIYTEHSVYSGTYPCIEPRKTVLSIQIIMPAWKLS